MMTALQYGNAAAYLTGTANFQTAFLNGLDTSDGNLGWIVVGYYSLILNTGETPPEAMNPQYRLNGANGDGGAAFVGRQGMRPVAFPANESWRLEQPIIT